MASSFPFLVHKFPAEGLLADVLRRQNPQTRLSLELRVKLALDVTMALEYLHSEGIVLGSVDTQGCVVTADWRAQIYDLSRAHLATEPPPVCTPESCRPRRRGTAPRQTLDPKSKDVWDLATLLWFTVLSSHYQCFDPNNDARPDRPCSLPPVLYDF